MENRNYYTLSSEENKQIFDESIAPSLYGNLKPVEEPKALFFRAQPGAGKSVAKARAIDQYADTTVMTIDIDGFRSFHPDYKALQQQDEASAAFYTDLDAGAWTERAVALSMDVRSNVTLEGTLRNEKPTLKTAQEYAARDIQSELYLLAVNELTSRSRIFQRYIEQLHAKGTGRYTLPEAHDAAYSVLYDTTQRTVESGLFRRINLIDKYGDVVDVIDGQAHDAADNVGTSFKRLRRLSRDEIDEVRATLAGLEEAISDQPNRMIRHDFEALVDDVRQQSRIAIGGLALASDQLAGRLP